MQSYEAKHAALEAVYKLGYALDALNYPELSQQFYSDRKFTFDIFALLKTPARDVTPQEYFQTAVGGLGGFDATQHVLSSPIVTIEDGKAHVKVMVTAFHGLFVDGKLEGANGRVTWNIDLENHEDQWRIIKWVIAGIAPIDRPDIFALGHKKAHDGELRKGIVGL